MRDGPQARPTVDALVRDALWDAQAEWRVIYGRGEQRTLNALQALEEVAPWAWRTDADPADVERWSRLASTCEKCGDAGCEHRLFTRLTERPT